MAVDTLLVSLSSKCTQAIELGYCPACDKILKDARNARRVKKRTYFKAISAFSAYKRETLRWITLTSSEEQSANFQRNFRRLIMRLRRRGLVHEYLRVPERTKDGKRHEHILFLGKYIVQRYLSYLWGKIHNSPVVWINKVGVSSARYLAKYASKFPQWRVSNSRAWCRKRLCGAWADWKRASRELNLGYQSMLKLWKNSLFLNVDDVLDFFLAMTTAAGIMRNRGKPLDPFLVPRFKETLDRS